MSFCLQNRWLQEKKTKIWVMKRTNLHSPLNLSICHTIKRQCISIPIHCCNIIILQRWKELLFTEKRTQKQQTFWTYLCYQIVANIRSRWDIIYLILIGNITNPRQEAFIEVSVNWAKQFYVKKSTGLTVVCYKKQIHTKVYKSIREKTILLEETTPNIACNISGDTQNLYRTICLEGENFVSDYMIYP